MRHGRLQRDARELPVDDDGVHGHYGHISPEEDKEEEEAEVGGHVLEREEGGARADSAAYGTKRKSF